MIYDYYKRYGRKFPFREKIEPYHVLVSEIMLQQTQTSQVSEKFLNFINLFPNYNALAEAPLDAVLKAWQGLGYNRRAIALKKIAALIIEKHDGKLPESIKTLKSFPQIGEATASSIAAFAFNKPTKFIETNIRRVYIYFFFPKQKKVDDKDIIPLVEETVDNENPREWYYALMDYGVMLKKTHPELTRRSTHYKKQKPFKGSNREIRGTVLKTMLKFKRLSEAELLEKLKFKEERIKKVLQQLTKEGFIKKENSTYLVGK